MDTFNDLKHAILSGTEHVNLYSYTVGTSKPKSDKPEGVNISMLDYGELFSMMYLDSKSLFHGV